MKDTDFWLAAAAAAPVIGLAHVVNLPNVTDHLKKWWRGENGRSTGEKVSDLVVLLIASSAVIVDSLVLLAALRVLAGFHEGEISLEAALWALVASMFAIIVVPVYDSVATAFTQGLKAIGKRRGSPTDAEKTDARPPSASPDSHGDPPDQHKDR